MRIAETILEAVVSQTATMNLKYLPIDYCICYIWSYLCDTEYGGAFCKALSLRLTLYLLNRSPAAAVDFVIITF